MAKFNGFVNDYTGLSNDEAGKLQEQFGKNELTSLKKETFFSKILGIFSEPIFLLLFCTAFLYFFLGEPKDGIIMLCFVAFMSGINLFQEWRTDRTLEELKDLSAPKVRVIRNGVLERIDTKELTVGDLMIIKEGDKADGQILEMFDLGVDESTLTGESEVVWKSLNSGANKEGWRKDCCYAGTNVTQGTAIIRVTAIGTKTEYGKIGLDILSVPEDLTPLQKQTGSLIKAAFLIGLALFVMVFTASFLNNKDFIESLLSGITLAMAMIPEEFPVILTVFLAMGAWRLAKKNTLVRKMSSVETLGAVSVLCVDKTGTLTKNQMKIAEIYTNNENELLYWAALGCEINPYDPMERAILKYANENGIGKEIFDKEMLFEYSFNSEIKMMGHVWEIKDKPNLAAKGSPESILPLCNLADDELEKLEKEQEKLSLKGYRVIAIAKKTNMNVIPKTITENELEFLGFIALIDPPRKAVPDAIDICSKAGIRVVMITGDNGITAKSIAKKIGIKNYDKVITGDRLEIMTDEELAEKVKITNIFARVMPSHKMRIVKALKDIGETVAMTGDGVNDAPALKYADIGIAMGKRGTNVAREASDMILLDDNFNTIVDTVADGRRIYDNIKKAIGYVFVIHIPIAFAALAAPIFQIPLLLLPVHVVLLELIIDPTCSIIFERQPAERDIMNKNPRSREEPLLTKELMIKSFLQGSVISAVTFGGYLYFINIGWAVETAGTITLLVFGFSNLLLVYVNQSEIEFAVSGILKKDKVIWYVNIGILIALSIIIYLPYANKIAKTLPLSLNQVFIAVVLSILATFWWEIVKLVKRIMLKKQGTV